MMSNPDGWMNGWGWAMMGVNEVRGAEGCGPVRRSTDLPPGSGNWVPELLFCRSG
jgi:hypothetical protein